MYNNVDTNDAQVAIRSRSVKHQSYYYVVFFFRKAIGQVHLQSR